jgi:hypothetical protein
MPPQLKSPKTLFPVSVHRHLLFTAPYNGISLYPPPTASTSTLIEVKPLIAPKSCITYCHVTQKHVTESKMDDRPRAFVCW